MRRLALIALLLLCPALALAAAQPYVPQPGDLADKDQPSSGTVRQVQSHSGAYRSVPVSNSSPTTRTGSGQTRFQPQPYVPKPGDMPGTSTITATTPAPSPTPSPTPPTAPGPPAVSQPATPATTKPPPVSAMPAPSSSSSEAKITEVINQTLAAYKAKDCTALLKLFHPQAYLLVRNPWGEQGSLGHQQLKEAHCADVGKVANVQLKSSRVEMIAGDRGKVWGQLAAKIQHQGQPTDVPASFEADLVNENGVWLITDAIIQYDAP